MMRAPFRALTVGLAAQILAVGLSRAGWAADAASDAEPAAEPRFRAGLGEGLVYEIPERSLRLHAGGVLAADHVQYDATNRRDSGPRLDRAVARIDGDLADAWWARIGVDLRGIDTRYGLEEAWIAHRAAPWLRVRAGLFDVPLGFEASFAEEDLPGVGYSFLSFLTTRTDVGVGVDGDLFGGALYYDAVVAAGEGFDLHGNERDSPQLSFRLGARPLQPFTDVHPLLGGLFAGLAFAWSPDFHDGLAVSTPLRNELFHAREFRADEARFYHIVAGWDLGPVRVVYEQVPGELFETWFGSGSGFLGVKTPAGEIDLDEVGGWHVAVAWTLTGEHYDSRPFDLRRNRGRAGAAPARPLFGAPEQDGCGIGLIELVAGYANTDIDREFFDSGLAIYAISSQEFRAATFALNWLPVSNLRFSAEVVRVLADQSPSDLNGHGKDLSYVFRAQWAF